MFGDWDAVEITDIESSSYISDDTDRGSHPPDEPDFNREIFNMLSDGAFPAPMNNQSLWLPQSK